MPEIHEITGNFSGMWQVSEFWSNMIKQFVGVVQVQTRQVDHFSGLNLARVRIFEIFHYNLESSNISHKRFNSFFRKSNLKGKAPEVEV
jgi:hypothetical protein